MSGSVLVPGAIVQHEKFGVGIVEEIHADGSFEISVSFFGGPVELMDVTFGQGWKPVGETGVRPEGTLLAWVSAKDLEFCRSQDGKSKINMSRTLEVVDHIAALNPEAQQESETP